MKPKFDCKVLHSDTDSLLYRINTIDVYEDVRRIIYILQHLHFSNYPPQHLLFCKVNEYIVLKFKDEFASVLIQQFCAHKPKLYSVIAIGKIIFITLTRINIQLVSWDCGENKSAKDVRKIAQRQLTHDRFKEIIPSGRLIRTQNHRIASSSHQLHRVTINKTLLNAFDDKRYILDNGIDTLPFGHINIVHDRFFDEGNNFDDESSSSCSSGPLYKIENQRKIETTVDTSIGKIEISNTGFVLTTTTRVSDIDSAEIDSDENEIEEIRPV